MIILHRHCCDPSERNSSVWIDMEGGDPSLR